MIDIYQEIVNIKAEGAEAALVTVVSAEGSTPREEGAKMVVKTDGSIIGTIGGGKIEERATREALEAIRVGKPKRLSFSLREGEELGMICGGNTEIFIEPILSPPTLHIFGGGHIGLSLVKISKLLGFKVVVIDNRPEYASAERFPEADLTILEEYDKSFQKLKMDNSSYIVIVTYGHKGDETVLEKALATEAKYIGMIGSRNKNRTVFSHLLAKGIPQEQIDRVHAPIGLDIKAQTPEEIAISILAEIILVRRSADTGARNTGHCTE